MPIICGGIGFSGIIATPGRRFGAATPNLDGAPTVSSYSFRAPPLSDYVQARITGITRDSTGSTLGNCVVQLFRTENDALLSELTSDASGNYSFTIGEAGPFYVVAYKAGAPDVAGTSVNTLVGV